MASVTVIVPALTAAISFGVPCSRTYRNRFIVAGLICASLATSAIVLAEGSREPLLRSPPCEKVARSATIAARCDGVRCRRFTFSEMT